MGCDPQCTLTNRQIEKQLDDIEPWKSKTFQAVSPRCYGETMLKWYNIVFLASSTWKTTEVGQWKNNNQMKGVLV